MSEDFARGPSPALSLLVMEGRTAVQSGGGRKMEGVLGLITNGKSRRDEVVGSQRSPLRKSKG